MQTLGGTASPNPKNLWSFVRKVLRIFRLISELLPFLEEWLTRNQDSESYPIKSEIEAISKILKELIAQLDDLVSEKWSFFESETDTSITVKKPIFFQ